MSLSVWESNGWIEVHKTSPREIADQLALADRDIHDSQVHALSPEWQLSIAYNAALRCATAALYASGFRAKRERHHERTIQSLSLTMESDRDTINTLDSFRQLRTTSDYDHVGVVSKKQAQEMLEIAIDLRARVEQWLRKYHADLLQ